MDEKDTRIEFLEHQLAVVTNQVLDLQAKLDTDREMFEEIENQARRLDDELRSAAHDSDGIARKAERAIR
jgi:imidazoleglycerol phosphate dehydratase HisB